MNRPFDDASQMRVHLEAEAVLGIIKQVELVGFTAMDALHIACARNAGVDVFLSTDDKLLKKASQHIDAIKLHAANPLAWLQEII